MVANQFSRLVIANEISGGIPGFDNTNGAEQAAVARMEWDLANQEAAAWPDSSRCSGRHSLETSISSCMRASARRFLCLSRYKEI